MFTSSSLDVEDPSKKEGVEERRGVAIEKYIEKRSAASMRSTSVQDGLVVAVV